MERRIYVDIGLESFFVSIIQTIQINTDYCSITLNSIHFFGQYITGYTLFNYCSSIFNAKQENEFIKN